ncbi:glycosyl hydrolase [Phnomibacter ginsenosidimutans]|uniref:Glycoside hydrolase family 2 protein n=1 Tax=Phnomibacter ginsenosidimutans TaxID=2676868 RepID=A0A6I6G7F7_9BACT|nr:glycosyl hydrolase [Phnomibacter ginsenosidimutans]QGW28636.1 glycoside hydrolase family 2 protein [Phnomibacter ginsenosidimutans]
MMKNKIVILICAAFFQLSVSAQSLQWPVSTAETKPWTRWWWQGSAVNKTDISRLLKMYSDAGLGGVEITPIYGVKGEEPNFIQYLSAQWVDMLQHTLQQATANGMQVDMATGTGWPFGGPWISYEHACKQVISKNWTLQKGTAIPDKIAATQQPFIKGTSTTPPKLEAVKDPVESNINLQQLAIDQVKFAKPLPLITLMAYPANASPIDITALVKADGSIDWVAPTDDCKVYALFLGWHGKLVERAAPGGEGNAIDHFSKPAIDTYFSKFDAAFAGKDISALRGFFNDSYEVDDARGQANWTPRLLDEFAQRKGYRLENYLPALFGKADANSNARVLFDYREVIAELILENFTQPWVAWAKKNGAIVRNQSHGSPGNTMDLYAAVDIPETEGTELLRFKFATSTAHVAGKKLAAAEAATWLDDHFVSTLGGVKKAIDQYFIGGVNHIVYHGTNYSPASAGWPGWMFYAAVHFNQNNPFWQQFPALNKYVERSQSFLQAGSIDNDVLVYYPFADAQMEHGRDLLKHYDAMRPEFNGTRFAHISEWMQAKGYGFDFISDKQLQQVSVRNGVLHTGGTSYKTILLPGNQYIPLASMQQLLQLVSQGAKLLVYHAMPNDVPGLANYDANAAALKQLLSGIQWKENGAVKTAQHGNGSISMSANEQHLLDAAGFQREALVDMGLQFIRRNYNGSKVYFICNAKDSAVDAWVPLNVVAAAVGIYNPMTGETGLAQTKRNSNGHLLVHLQLPAAGSLFVQVGAVNAATKYPLYQTIAKPVAIGKTWAVSFDDRFPNAPAATTVSSLTSWSEWGNAFTYYSGVATYRSSFARPAGNAKWYRLNLGKVGESANVWINGKKAGTVLGPDYTLIVDAAWLKPTNSIQIEVSNSMANQMILLEKNGVPWKKFYNTNFPAKLAENRGADGLFTPIKWMPKPSGLLSEVTLTALQKL